MRTDQISDLLRSVGDDSTPHEKALWHALNALEDIRDANSNVAPALTAARALQAVERALR